MELEQDQTLCTAGPDGKWLLLAVGEPEGLEVARSVVHVPSEDDCLLLRLALFLSSPVVPLGPLVHLSEILKDVFDLLWERNDALLVVSDWPLGAVEDRELKLLASLQPIGNRAVLVCECPNHIYVLYHLLGLLVEVVATLVPEEQGQLSLFCSSILRKTVEEAHREELEVGGDEGLLGLEEAEELDQGQLNFVLVVRHHLRRVFSFVNEWDLSELSCLLLLLQI